jgi:hypothetical protein
METSARIEKSTDFAATPAGMAQRWGTEIAAAEQEIEPFHRDARKIIKRYLDRRDAWEEDESRVNLFWSTVKVLLSMLYARPPKADVSRAWQDAEDDQARVAGTMLQRLLNKDFEEQVSSWDSTIRQGIEDWLVVGMGQCWMRYEVETEEVEIPAVIDPMTGMEIQPAQMVERITEEEAELDYVHYQDFFWSPARTWREVRWVARRVHMTREQLEARFGEAIAKSVPMIQPKRENDEQTTKHDPWARAEVFEIWCKENEKVYWFAKGAPVILDVKDDPLGISGFFPCPMPLAANVTSVNFLPRADYVFAQDQFNELDEINTRIKWLTRAAKVVGVYDKAADGLQRMFQQASENQLIPVDNWAMFAESGGIKGKVDWVPIDAVVNAIERLRVYRADKTQQIYEVLGISDIMRGATRSGETATAQQIKAQFGSTRIQLLQFYIAQWITEVLRIKAEIIAKHFQPETIVERSNVLRTPDAPLAQAGVQLLKDEEVAQYRIVVEADSMAQMDWAAERDAAVQFMQGLGAFISQVAPMAQQVPEAGPYLMRIMQWAVSKFRVSTEIESILDQAVDGMQKQLMQPKPPPQPAPDVVVQAQIEAEKIKSNERIAAMEAQNDQQIASLKATVDLQKIEMQARFDNFQKQYDQISNLLTALPGTSQVMELDAIKQMVEQNKADTDAQLSQVMTAVSRKKKRIPIRDQMGDIVEVREIDDDDNVLPPGVVSGPPGSPVMN